MADAQVEARGAPRWAVVSVVMAVLAMVVAGAVIWPGYDAQEAPKEEVSVWALQSVGGKRYARLNTELEELDTVREVENATSVFQSGSQTVLFVEGDSRFVVLDEANPPELVGDVSEYFEMSPSDTDQVVGGGDYLAFLTGEGQVYVAPLADPGAAMQVNPYADVQVAEGEDMPVFRASAVALSPDGKLAAFSSEEGRVVFADPSTGVVSDQKEWPIAGEGPLQLAFVGEELVAFEPESGSVWFEGEEDAVASGADASAILQQSGPNELPLIADSRGLLEVSREGATRKVELAGAAVPAQPALLEQTMFAAWLGTAAGVLWSSSDGEVELSYGGVEAPEVMVPKLVSNGAKMVVNDTASGWLWLAPSGRLVPSSQRWDIEQEVIQQTSETVVEKVVEPKPPVAEPDEFGVRAGRETLLPVLLNDHDPNMDVLAVAADSVEGLPPEFGSVFAASDGQQLVVRVTPEAQGTATFTYRATDGTAPDGLVSEPATVTLTVVPDDIDSAPVWCGVTDCLAPWPTPTVVPGGTVKTQVLAGWVDPDGDPLYLLEASTPEVGSVIANPDGTVSYRHPDANVGDPLTVPIEITVADTRGQVARKTLNIQVTPTPQLEMLPVLASGVTGEPTEVDLSEFVTGAVGRPRITAATPATKDGVEVKASSTELSFSLAASKPGSYPVQVSVADDVGEITGQARVVITDPADAEISALPITVFVRPNEDTTVDLMPTVTNPADFVLMVDELSFVPDDNAELAASIVGQRNLHASGRTLDGRPGALGVGSFRVSDGSGDPGRTAVGQVTFVLLEEAPAAAPITTDDWVSVPVGAQVDIPVLDSDITPVGSQLTLDPASVVNEQQAGLAFGSGRVLRYLAPEEPGEYSVTYSAARMGYPELASTARVHITVQNTNPEVSPRPRALSGRVLQGKSVEIPFDRFKADQNGAIVELFQVSKQPEKGTASISPEGDAIVFSANPQTRGQDSFEYQVRDQAGKVGTGTVKIGILDAEADPRPITYSDYLQIQVGEDSEAVVNPAASDFDPAGGALTVIDVAPNAPEGTELYESLRQRLLGFDEDTGEVRIRAGAELGTTSYVYTVQNATGDTAKGLIIVKVVRGKVPDAPIVRDTTLTAETLELLPQGVDVVTDNVAWATGDVADLQMTLWDDPIGYEAKGWKIAGQIPREWKLVPFKLEGTSFLGEPASTYGFLRVPGETDFHLALRAAYSEVQVNEGASVEINLSEAVAVPPGEVLELDAASVHASGVRQAGSCTTVDGTTVRYSAGRGAPWYDSCVVPVKIPSMEYFTYLSISVKVVPEVPQPTLRNASFEVSPGQSAMYDLQQMVQWEGQPQWESLQFQVSAQGTFFEVTSNGAQLQVIGKDTARQGNSERVTVTLPSHPEVPPATLNLTVGPAPGQRPEGGALTLQCSQNQGGSCSVPISSAAGQYNALPATPLRLVSVSNPASCPGVTFTAQGESILASWAAGTPGRGDCTAGFVVADAQNREGTGSITLDLRGYPAAPATLEWVGYTDSSVELRVVPAGASHPEVQGYTVTGGGKTGTCTDAGVCRVNDLPLGTPITFEARTVNAVGSSADAATVTAYAYRAPGKPEVSAVPVPNGDVGERARVTIKSADATTGSFVIDDVATGPVSLPYSQDVTVPNGAGRNVKVVPVSKFAPPKLASGQAPGEGQAASILAFGIGAPVISIQNAGVDAAGLASASVVVENPNGNPDAPQIGIVHEGSCIPTPGGSTSATKQLNPGQEVTFTACARNVYNGQTFGATSQVEVRSEPVKYGILAPTVGSYTIDSNNYQVQNGREYFWFQVKELTAPTPAPGQSATGVKIRYAGSAEGEKSDALVDLFEGPGSGPLEVWAFSCVGDQCSPGTQMTREGALPQQVSVTFPVASGERCPEGSLQEAITTLGVAPSDLVYSTEGNPAQKQTVKFPWHGSLQWSCVIASDPGGGPGDEG